MTAASSWWQREWEVRPALWSGLAVLLVALLASATGIGNGFTYDDIPVVVENPMVQQSHSLWTYLTDSYWGPSRGNSLYRPVTVIAFALQRAAGQGDPLPFHITNIALYLASALAALALAREFMRDGAALFAALVFAAHPVHVEAVANVVGQSEMLAGIPMLIALTLYVRDRRIGELRARTVAAIAVLFGIALLAKEHGILLPFLLLLAEITLSGTVFVRAVAPRPRSALLARVLTMMVLAYLVVRLTILGGFAGDAPHPALEGLALGQRLWVMLALVPDFVRLFLWPARLLADYSPSSVPFLTAPGLGHLLGAACLLLVGALLVFSWRRDRVSAFALLWVGLTLGPVSNILIATGVLIAERTLFLPSVGVALLVARVPVLLGPAVSQLSTRFLRIAVPMTVAVVLAAATARSAVRQLDWEDNATLFATPVVDAPANFRAHHALGELFGSAGAWKRAEHHLRIADSLFPNYDLLELSLARVLHFDDRCPEALPVYTKVLEQNPYAEVAYVGRAACRLEMRQLSAARDDAIAGIGRGFAVGSFAVILQKAESSLVATDTVDDRNRWYRAGAPFSRSDARLRVPVLLMKPSSALIRGRMRETVPDPG